MRVSRGKKVVFDSSAHVTSPSRKANKADLSLLCVFCLRVNGIEVKMMYIKLSIFVLYTFIKEISVLNTLTFCLQFTNGKLICFYA